MSRVATAGPAVSALHELADEAGIIRGYRDQTGTEWRETSDETRRLILEAMGLDGSTDEAAARSLELLRAERRFHLLEPVRVVRHTDPSHNRVRISLEGLAHTPLRWEMTLTLEDGEVVTLRGERSGEGAAAIDAELPVALPAGYHRLFASVSSDDGTLTAEQLRIVVPPSCVRAEELLGGRRAWGLVANLYTIRSARNWGIGDATDLGDLAEWAASLGAQFIGLNPLHAVRNAGPDVSPYSPITRLYGNPAYIDVDAVPEVRDAPGLRLRLDSAEHAQRLTALRRAAVIDYEAVMALKWPVLRACFDAAAVRESGERWQEFRAWVQSQGERLVGFARHMARELGGFRSDATPRFDDPERADVDFHCWVQWELDRQLGMASRRAKAAGMRIGLYQDLAIGSASTGSDAECFPDLFVQGMTVGAPPDPYSAQGQNWGFPPVNPHRLAADRYRYFIGMVQAGLRNAGALRIDHVMGLFRLFWIPEGRTGRDGAYVRYPSEDLLGILALESVRNRALIVGEDLGTVPLDVPPAMEAWGIMSSKVLYFEREPDGSFRPPEAYAAHALATANTHDLPTLIGFARGRDVTLRIEHGLVEQGAEAAARDARARERAHLLDRLIREGVLTEGDAEDMTAFRAAVHDMLASSPAALVGVALDDVAGEVEAVNLPGVGLDQYASWQRRMTRTLEEIRHDPDVVASLGTRLLQGR